ncbi:MAG: type II secretion system F family protein, partial [Planctomycetota bacterium]
ILLMGLLTPAGGGQMPDILGLGLRGGDGVIKLWSLLGVALLGIAIVLLCFKRNYFGIQNLAPVLYLIPYVGKRLQTITLSRFCQTFALALEVGLDPFRGITIAMDSTGSEYYRAASKDAHVAIREGASLSGALHAAAIFPDDFIARVDMAEHSGTDAESMNHLAREYREQAEMAIQFMAVAATMLVRLIVMCGIVYFILKIAMFYVGALNSAMEPI